MDSATVLRRYLAAIVVVVAGWTLSGAGYWLAHDVEAHNIDADFRQLAKDRIDEVRGLLQDQVESVEVIRDLYLSSHAVERGEFHDFALAALLRHDCARAFAWCPHVTHAERETYTANARQDGLDHFSFTERGANGLVPAAVRPDYVPVFFLAEGASELPFRLGFDLASVPEWRSALERACVFGGSAVVDIVPLPGVNAAPQPAFVLALPLYRKDAQHATPDERQRNLVGYVLGISAIDDLLDKAFGSFAREKIHFTLADAQAAKSSAVLYSTLVADDHAHADRPRHAEKVIFADRELRLECRASAEYLAAYHSWHALVLLLGGGLLCSLAAAFLAASSYRHNRTERLIVERDSALRVKETEHARSEATLSAFRSENAILAAAVSNTTAGVIITDACQADNPIIFANNAFTITTGYGLDEATGRNCRFLQGAKTDPETVHAIRAAVAAAKPFRGEILNYRKNGSTFWNDLSITPVYDEKNSLVYFVGIQTDVSEQKYASLALQRERDRLQRQLVFANAFARAAEVVVSEDDNRALLTGLARTVGQALGVDRALIHDVDLSRRLSVALCEWLNPEAGAIQSVLDVYPLELFPKSSLYLAETRTWIESHDDALNHLFTGEGSAPLIHGRMANRSVLWYPFQFRTTGFYLMTFSQLRFRRVWKEDEIAFIEAVSKLASVALEKIRLLSQRRLTDEAIRASENRYRAIVEDQSELICRFRTDSIITFVNEAYCRYFAKNRADLEGQSFMPVLPDEDREIAHRQFASLTPQHTAVTYTHRVILSNQSVHWVQWTVRGFFDQLGQALEYQAVGQDITERKQAEDSLRASEASFRSLIEQAPEGILIANLEGDYVEVNPAACSLVGYSRQELLRMNIRDLLAEDEQRPLDERLRLYREGHTLFGERSMRRKDGSKVAVEMIAKQLPDQRLLAIIRDITERQRAERALREAKETAERANLAKSAFLANMSHEIRTPMNGVLGMIGLMLESPLDPELREFAETARSSGEHLLTIINEILDFSKVEADRLELEEILFELPTLVEETVSLFAEQAQGKNLELTCFVHPDVPQALRGDPSRLRQVLINLLGNAVKFTTSGEVTVRVGLEGEHVGGMTGHFRVPDTEALPGMPPPAEPPTTSVFDESDGELEPQEEEAVHLRFTVTDTGPGIPEEAHDRLFQAFSQADASTTRRYGGTGLGLAISRRLVELMGGSIGFTSTPGGTVFYFSATLKRPVSGAEPPLAPEFLRALRVLVVDDNATSREFLCARMHSWGLNCEAVADPPHALSVLRDAHYAGPPFSLLLLDLEMPGMDGIELARAIRGDPDLAGLHLIAMTSLTRRGPCQEARRLGAAACLTKPVRSVPLLDALIATVENEVVGGAKTRSTPAQSGARVLVAEDNLVNRRLALAQLAHLGMRADAVANGREALAALERVPYDLVLMDGQMPEMDGYSATAAIRKRDGTGQHTIIIAMTADALVGDRERCLAAGMDDYLSKPVKLADLRVMVTRWLTPRVADGDSDAGGGEAHVADGPQETSFWDTDSHSKRGDHDTTRSESAGEKRPTTRHEHSSDRHPTTHTERSKEKTTTARYRKLARHDDGLDPAVIEDLLAQGGIELLFSLSEAMKEEAPTVFAEIAAGMAKNEPTAANAAVHRLKGAAWSLGLRDLAAACLAVEHAIGTGLADSDRLRQVMEQEYQRACASLDHLIKGISPG